MKKTPDNNNHGSFHYGGLRRQGLRKHNSQENPLISIITVVFNGEAFLEQTINSVRKQNYDNIEYIIIDGGSTDNSLDIIRRYEKGIDYWHSAPDHSLYDAMNKGIDLASGGIIGIINADDWYNPGIFTTIARVHRHNPNTIIHGGMSIFENQQEKYRLAAPEKLDKLPKGMIINHPTVFIPRALYQQYGAFDTTFKIAADWDLILRLWGKKIRFHALPEIVANFRLGGASYTYNRQQIEEKHAIRIKNLLNGRCDWYYWLDRIKLIFPEKWITRVSLKKQRLLGV